MQLKCNTIHTVPNLPKYIAKMGQCAAVNIIPCCRYFFVSFEIFRNRMGLINIHITQGGRRGESSILIILTPKDFYLIEQFYVKRTIMF